MTVTKEAGHGDEAEEASAHRRNRPLRRMSSPERWSVQRKSDFGAPTLARRSALPGVSRERQAPADELKSPKWIFLEQETRGPKTRDAE
jgi:hypothetical protein